jgi:type VI secretion system secreted protein VgrG
MKHRYLIILAIGALAALLYAPLVSAASILGTAQNFAVLGASTVTNTGPTVITGDLGLYSGTSITGFPPGIVDGTTYIADAAGVAQTAQANALTAYNGLAGMAPTGGNLTGQDLGGMTLLPGVYKFNSSAQLTGTLTLNAEGMNNAYWVFQIGSTLTTATSSKVNVINENSSNPGTYGLFWQVGSSATLGTSTAFEGNILALTSITLDTSATILNGRALALNGAVTMDTNTISNVCPAYGLYTSPGPGYDQGLVYKSGAVVPVGLSPVPVPATIFLLGPGLLGLALRKKKIL